MKWRCGLAGKKTFDEADVVEMYCSYVKNKVPVAVGSIIVTTGEDGRSEFLKGTCYVDDCPGGGRIVDADKDVRDCFQMLRCRRVTG